MPAGRPGERVSSASDGAKVLAFRPPAVRPGGRGDVRRRVVGAAVDEETPLLHQVAALREELDYLRGLVAGLRDLLDGRRPQP
jgi:hypothetical protein